MGGRGGGGAQLPQKAGKGGEPLLNDGGGDQRERGLILRTDGRRSEDEKLR